MKEPKIGVLVYYANTRIHNFTIDMIIGESDYDFHLVELENRSKINEEWYVDKSSWKEFATNLTGRVWFFKS